MRLIQWLLARLHVPTHDVDGWIYCAHPACVTASNDLRRRLGMDPLVPR